MFYKDKIVVVVGGGNSAVSDAVLLSRIAKKVIIVHRRDTLRATKIYYDQLMKTENIEFRWNNTVKDVYKRQIVHFLRILKLHRCLKRVKLRYGNAVTVDMLW